MVYTGLVDLNPRPVAAATALQYPYELISTSSALVISLALRCFGTSGKAFTVDENPRRSMFRRLGITSVMAANTLSEIFARTDVAATSLLAAQYVTIKHSSAVSGSHRAGGI